MVYLIAAMLVAVPSLAFGDPLTAAISTSIAGFLGGGAFATAIGQLAASMLLTAVASVLLRQRPTDLARDLAQPTSLPQYRFVYGEGWATGTPAPVRTKGKYIYACYLLNSRPSVGPFTVLFDKREVVLSGDPYDFHGPGAAATNDYFDDHVLAWIGRGDQTAPPDLILAEAGDIYSATDGWQGRTVLWLRLDAGGSNNRPARWPSAPPEVIVDGKWSRVWDPRDPAQDADDPATWQWSANQALCALDALRQNPLKPYDLRNLWLETWIWAANVADELVTNKDASTSRRYEVHGTLAFSEGAELEDQLAPLMDAGASRFVRARGQLGIVPGCAQDVALVLTDMLDDQPPQLVRYADRDSIATTAVAQYPAPDRAYEMTDAPTYIVPGALAEDGGLESLIQPEYALVTDHRQVQRLQKIAALRSRMQRRLTAVFPPEAFGAVAGSWVEVDLPAPYARWSRVYEVESTQPALIDPEGDGVVLRCVMVLREVVVDIYAWDAATEEQDVEAYVFDGSIPTPEPPGAITLTTGAAVAVVSGGVSVARVRFAFDPSPSASAVAYEVQYRVDGGAWTAGGTIDGETDDGAGHVFGFAGPAEIGADYEVRARTLSSAMASEWVVSGVITASSGAERYFADFDDDLYRIDGVAMARSQLVSLTRPGPALYIDAAGVLQTAAANVLRIDHATGVPTLLVEATATNAWTYSQEIDNAAWTKTGATPTANAGAAPDGTITADKLVEDTSTGTHYLRRARSFVGATRADFSFFVKAAGRSVIRASCAGAGMVTQLADINLGTGAVAIVSGAPSVRSYALAGGWWWVTMSFVPSASTAGFFDLLLINGGSNSYTGDGVSGALIWGLQDGAGSYIPTTSAPVARAADVAALQGITATLDLTVRDGDGIDTVLAGQGVSPGFWPAISASRIRQIIGRTP